jgi:APA family basic amino acid/polyamine antiporter
VDLRGAIGFSSFAVLAYYAIANASALTLPGPLRTRLLPVVGLAGCVLLAVNLPWPSVAAGAAVLAAGAAVWLVRARRPIG